MAFNDENKPACKHLVLDAGPLLSLSPLRGLAETYYTVPQVLDELKDKRAREHFEKLALSAGVRVQVQSPDAKALSHVIQFAKKTGDYSVLSTADLCVLALTYALEQKEVHEEQKAAENTESESAAAESSSAVPEAISSLEINEGNLLRKWCGRRRNQEREPLDVQIERISEESSTDPPQPTSEDHSSPPHQDAQPNENDNSAQNDDDAPIYSDPSDEDDGEGEWITPSNVSLHKSRALGFIPDDSAAAKKRSPAKQIRAGCMTADFAMQNVLWGEGKRIERVKTWVLRCHACFKLCKDSSRKFCPSCGSPTSSAPPSPLLPHLDLEHPSMQVHLKKNFNYKTRGVDTREDQSGWVKAKKLADGKREREEKRLLKGSGGSGKADGGARLGSWMDPDWVPEMLSVGAGGKGRSMRSAGFEGDMPVVGFGRKNPNERRRRK
ncbi:Nin one binding Zn-ribbon like-domain-containing protein [Irpex lacteus]|nr:Nin one binding Zn-ribbon like-domain-containing protein [Irpex lacteus]